MTTSSVVDYAAKYLSMGFQLVPLHCPIRNGNRFICSCGRLNCQSPAKHPVGNLVLNGTKNATSDLDLVKQWFETGLWNLGIVTGSKSNLIALDIDPRHDGNDSLAALEAKHGPIPRTIQFLTGGGGQHILLRHPGSDVPNSAGKIGKGLDVRGQGGFIVAPPSQHISGRPYTISVDHHPDDVPLADAPPWLVELMRFDAVSASSPQDWRSRIGSLIPEGRRNDSLARIAGHLLGHGIDPHVALDLMLSLNATHCTTSLPVSEVLNIVASIANREIAKRCSRQSKETNRG